MVHHRDIARNTNQKEPDMFRTLHGRTAHASAYCANFRRKISSGDVIEIPAAEVGEWAVCSVCAGGTAQPKAAAAPAVTQCRNSAVTRPGRIRSTCTDCGKEGAVNRSTGTLRAHAPQV